MKLDKNFLLYLLYRGLSSFFFVVSIYTLMLVEDFNLIEMSFYVVFAFVFMYLYMNVKPIPKQTLCLEHMPLLLGSLVSTFLIISYGVFSLSLYMTLLSKSILIEVVVFSFMFFLAMLVLYIYLCKLNPNYAIEN